MYVRVKRRKTTLFFHVEPTETVAAVKARVAELLQRPPEEQRLAKGGVALEDGATLAEARVETDDVLTLALRGADGEFDDPEVADPGEAGEAE